MTDKSNRLHSIFCDVEPLIKEEVLKAVLALECAEDFMRVLNDHMVAQWKLAQASEDNDQRIRYLGKAEMVEDLIQEFLDLAE